MFSRTKLCDSRWSGIALYCQKEHKIRICYQNNLCSSHTEKGLMEHIYTNVKTSLAATLSNVQSLIVFQSEESVMETGTIHMVKMKWIVNHAPECANLMRCKNSSLCIHPIEVCDGTQLALVMLSNAETTPWHLSHPICPLQCMFYLCLIISSQCWFSSHTKVHCSIYWS